MPVSLVVKCTLFDVAMLSFCLVAALRHSWKDVVVACERLWGVEIKIEFEMEARDLNMGIDRGLYRKWEGACIIPNQRIKREVK